MATVPASLGLTLDLPLAASLTPTKVVEIIPKRLYWACCETHSPPTRKGSESSFSTVTINNCESVVVTEPTGSSSAAAPSGAPPPVPERKLSVGSQHSAGSGGTTTRRLSLGGALFETWPPQPGTMRPRPESMQNILNELEKMTGKDQLSERKVQFESLENSAEAFYGRYRVCGEFGGDYEDFGPLDLTQITKFARFIDMALESLGEKKNCNKLRPNLTTEELNAKDLILVFCDSRHQQSKMLGILAIAAYCFLSANVANVKTAKQAFKLFSKSLDDADDTFPCSFMPRGFMLSQRGLPAEDRVRGRPLKVLDCLEGLEFAKKQGWYDFDFFDDETFESFRKTFVSSWIIPDRFLAICDPMSVIYHCALAKTGQSVPEDVDVIGWGGNEELVDAVREESEKIKDFFMENNIKLLIRLNDPKSSQFKLAYPDAWFAPFTECKSFCFADGGVPTEETVMDFIKMCREHRDGAVAVHCQAGFGRTGTMIGCFAMAAFSMPPHAFHGWVRMCRPGSINAPQQERFLDWIWEILQTDTESESALPPSDTERETTQITEGTSASSQQKRSHRHVDRAESSFLKRKKSSGPASTPR